MNQENKEVNEEVKRVLADSPDYELRIIDKEEGSRYVIYNKETYVEEGDTSVLGIAYDWLEQMQAKLDQARDNYKSLQEERKNTVSITPFNH